MLHYFATCSLKEGMFPECLKCGEVVSLYKGKGSRSEPGNYRPITLSSPFAKILEKVVDRNLRLYCDVSGSLPDTQHGFRPGGSRRTADFARPIQPVLPRKATVFPGKLRPVHRRPLAPGGTVLQPTHRPFRRW